MDCFIDFDPTHHVVRATVTTRVLTDKRLMDLYYLFTLLGFQADPCAGVFDLSEVERFLISAQTTRILAVSDPAVPPGRPRVIVAKQDVAFGLSRMFKSVRGSADEQLYVVRSLDEAYDLLGVKPEDFSQRLFPERSAA